MKSEEKSEKKEEKEKREGREPPQANIWVTFVENERADDQRECASDRWH